MSYLLPKSVANNLCCLENFVKKILLLVSEECSKQLSVVIRRSAETEFFN